MARHSFWQPMAIRILGNPRYDSRGKPTARHRHVSFLPPVMSQMSPMSQFFARHTACPVSDNVTQRTNGRTGHLSTAGKKGTSARDSLHLSPLCARREKPQGEGHVSDMSSFVLSCPAADVSAGRPLFIAQPNDTQSIHIYKGKKHW